MNTKALFDETDLIADEFVDYLTDSNYMMGTDVNAVGYIYDETDYVPVNFDFKDNSECVVRTADNKDLSGLFITLIEILQNLSDELKTEHQISRFHTKLYSDKIVIWCTHEARNK